MLHQMLLYWTFLILESISLRERGAAGGGMPVMSGPAEEEAGAGATPGGAKHPEYAEPESRKLTYSWWPRGLAQKPDALVEAGLFYTGRGDKVTCFYCGESLCNWDPEDLPWEEHARNYPTCQFVLDNKGQQFIQQVSAAASQRMENPTPVVEESMAISITQEEVARACRGPAPPVPKCRTCAQHDICVVLLPCGHMAMCGQCADEKKETNCPLCRVPIQAFVKAFMS